MKKDKIIIRVITIIFLLLQLLPITEVFAIEQQSKEDQAGLTTEKSTEVNSSSESLSSDSGISSTTATSDEANKSESSDSSESSETAASSEPVSASSETASSEQEEIQPTLIEKIQLTVPKSKISIGESIQLNVIVEPADADQSKLDYQTVDTSVVTVSDSGVVTGLKKGETKLIVTDQQTKQAAEISIQVVQTRISYQTHVQNIGWQPLVTDGQTSGTTGSSYRLEALKLQLEDATYTGNIEYRTHVQNIGWQGWQSNGNLSGTTGQALRLEAIQIRLTGELATHYDVYYRTHIQNEGWLSWASNGNSSGSQGLGLRLEALEIKLVAKGSGDFVTSHPFIDGSQTQLNYQTHVQNIGWQDVRQAGQISGTTGQSLRVEALSASITSGLSGSITYQGHVQNIGWQSVVSNGAIAGTTDKQLRLEALKINLTGDLAKYYDIYYRAHIEGKGWLQWGRNGMNVGSIGAGKRLEAIEIRLFPKNSATLSIGKSYCTAADFPNPVQFSPTYFSQLDSSWKDYYVGMYKIGPTGCVPTSMAMVINGYGKGQNPVSVAQTAYRISDFNHGIPGASAQAFTQVIQYYGLNPTPLYSQASIQSALENGLPVLAMLGSPFTFAGATHAVMIYGYSNGNVRIYDPYANNVSGWHTLSSVWRYQSTNSFDRKPGYVFVSVAA